MEENYIHIFCYFLGDLVGKEKISLKDAYFLIGDFKAVAVNIKSREDLIVFLDKNTAKYWEFKELKKQLLNKEHIFTFNEI